MIGIAYNNSGILFNPLIPAEWNSLKIVLSLNLIDLNLTLKNNRIKGDLFLKINISTI
ncbi:MAG: hypothetical protein ACTSYZ_02990 [Candidatus Helarchaeota archaeon]